MALINIFKNWQKAKDYDKLEEINDKLCIEIYDLNDLKKDIRDVEDYAIGLLTDAPYVHPMLVEIVDVLKDLKATVIDYKIRLMRVESKLQKRDKKNRTFRKKVS